MREIIIRNIDNAPNGKEFFAGISGNFKDFGQTLCELIDNPISNFRAHKRRGRVEIVLEEQGDYVDVMVRDNGTGHKTTTSHKKKPDLSIRLFY